MEIIKVTNINSKAVPPHSTKLTSQLGFLFHTARRIPVYLVNPELMDLIYPPEKRVVIDEEKLKEKMKQYEEVEMDEIPMEDILKSSKKEISPEGKEEIIIAVGVYIHKDTNNKISSHISKIDNSFTINFPAIFISPERVYNWADRINISPDIPFADVLYHELCHAYIYNPNKKGDIFKIIEESYCNAIAFSRFNKVEEIEEVMKAIDNQPFEYRGYTCFIDKPSLFWYSLYLHPVEPLDFLHYLWIRYPRDFLLFNDIFRIFQLIWKKDKYIQDPNKFYKYLAYFITKEILGE